MLNGKLRHRQLRIGVAWDGRELRQLAEQLTMLEIGPTQARIVSPRVLHEWARVVEDLPDFRFSVKLFAGFTHELRWPQLDVDRVFDGLEPLLVRGRVEALLAQFPSSFVDSPESRRRLMRIARTFGTVGLQMELPHPSWRIPPLYEWLREHEIGLVAGHPETPILTSDVAYARIKRISKPWIRAVCSLRDRSRQTLVICRRLEDALSLRSFVEQGSTAESRRRGERRIPHGEH